MLATYGDGDRAVRYVHQRLNTSVFADIDTLMDNVLRVTAHLAAQSGDTRRVLRLHPAADGRPYAQDAAGAPWRTLAFIDGARTDRRFSGASQAAEGARCAARLVADLVGLQPPLPEVIPGFHDVVGRVGHLEAARDADPCGRGAGCQAEVDAVLGHAAVAIEVAVARADGRLPQRTVHNDAKVENLLFDSATGVALCLVDLDTVGPGTVLFDVGDLVRSGAACGPEDGGSEDGGSDTIAVDHDIVAAVLDGYAGAGAGFLTPAELDLLPLAGPLMALEAGARFLSLIHI